MELARKLIVSYALKAKTQVAGLPDSIPHAQSNSLTYNYLISYIKQFLYCKTIFIKEYITNNVTLLMELITHLLS